MPHHHFLGPKVNAVLVYLALCCPGLVTAIHATPYVSSRGYYDYLQTGLGSGAVQRYGTTVGIYSEGSGLAANYLPQSILFEQAGGILPSNQLAMSVPIDFSSNITQGPGFTGIGVGGEIPDGSGGLMFALFYGNMELSSSDPAKSTLPISLTVNGGSYDGFTQTVAFDFDLAPEVPLFTAATIMALTQGPWVQATLVQFAPVLAGIATAGGYSYGLIEIDPATNAVIKQLHYGTQDFSSNGFVLPSGLIEADKMYALSIQTYNDEPPIGKTFYSVSNVFRFSTSRSHVPETGSTLVVLGTALSALAISRHRKKVMAGG